MVTIGFVSTTSTDSGCAGYATPRPIRPARSCSSTTRVTGSGSGRQSVLLSPRWTLSRLRDQRLFSLDDANRAIAAACQTAHVRVPGFVG